MSDNPQENQNRARHRPLSMRIESVSKLPDVRELPQDTEMTINLKMDRKMGYQVIREILEQLALPTDIDFVAITITGVS